MKSLAIMLALLVACGAPGTLEPGATASSVPGDPRAEAARSDLAARLGVGEAEIEVVVLTEVTWPDGSIGCPQPGMSYTQALVEGYYVELRASDRTYAYHGQDDVDPFYCEGSEGPPG